MERWAKKSSERVKPVERTEGMEKGGWWKGENVSESDL